ncbi:MAG: transglutaminaseTgpA domain-containing protein [Verrucomicrobiota bacterium]
MLGLLCQGLTWDDYFLPLLYAGLWTAGLLLPRRPIRLGQVLEAMALIMGVGLGYGLGFQTGHSTHFAIGHGLATMQLTRLLRPLERREKLYSLLIALFHLATACTFLFDYRLLAIMAGAVWLIPRALAEMEAGSFQVAGTPCPEGRSDVHPALGYRIYAWVAAGMIVCFLTFPRGLFTGGIRLPVSRSADQNTLLDNVLDPSRSGGQNSRRILFQIQGEQLGYLRCYALTEFDGTLWTPDNGSAWRNIELDDEDIRDVRRYPTRQVRVKKPEFLGRMLPVDGRLVAVRGTFFRRAYLTTHGLLEAQVVWTSPNNSYTYWIGTNLPPESLRDSQAVRFTTLPPQSDRLKKWLNNVVQDIPDPYDQARFLERHLQRTLTYQLGAPELNRLAPTDDFIFNQRTGHCERFASTLAVLLRMQGIPSRVIIGYLPSSRNRLSGWFDIRLRDAHSWTEAWFPDRGWVTLDATPAASLPPPSVWSDWIEELDFAWYTHVVNFDAPMQSALLMSALQGAGYAAIWSRQHWPVWLALLLLPLGWLTWQGMRQRWGCNRQPPSAQRESQRMAEHYYGRLLHHLAQRGFPRLPPQTPLEFLADLRDKKLPNWHLAEQITTSFCATKYGRHVITSTEQATLEAALKQLQDS